MHRRGQSCTHHSLLLRVERRLRFHSSKIRGFGSRLIGNRHSRQWHRRSHRSNRTHCRGQSCTRHDLLLRVERRLRFQSSKVSCFGSRLIGTRRGRRRHSRSNRTHRRGPRITHHSLLLCSGIAEAIEAIERIVEARAAPATTCFFVQKGDSASSRAR